MLKRFLPLLAFAVPFAAALTVSAQTTPANRPADATIPGLRGYQSWTAANKNLYTVPRATAYLCAGPQPGYKPTNPHENTDPYRDAYIRVYVNSMGKGAFLKRNASVIPVGTVIVKEKRPMPDAPPELLTVMVKRQKGFDAANGDWEYFAVSGDATRILEPGKIAHCQKCHLAMKDKGYVFRDYLPLPVR